MSSTEVPPALGWLAAAIAAVAGCDLLPGSSREEPAASSVPSAVASVPSAAASIPLPSPSVSATTALAADEVIVSTRAVPLPLTVMTSTTAQAALRREFPVDEAPTLPKESSTVEPSVVVVPERPSGLRDYPQNVADRPVPRIGTQPWMISEEWEARHKLLLRSPNRAKAKVVFLGDSITDGWRASPSYREHFAAYSPLNLGITREYTQNLLWRIAHGALDGLTPDAVVVLIGVNNLGGGFTPEQTASGVRAVVTAVRAQLPKTPVLLLAILPARESPEAPLRKKIVETNRLIANLAEPGRVMVHDVGSVLLEPDGTITSAVLRDFLHPSEVGYERLSAAVAPLLEKLVQRQ